MKAITTQRWRSPPFLLIFLRRFGAGPSLSSPPLASPPPVVATPPLLTFKRDGPEIYLSMVRGPRHASRQSMRNCMGLWEVHDGWWMGMGVGATPTVREGGGRAWDCAMGPEVGGRQLCLSFYISW